MGTRDKANGFTLIELLVTVAILGVIAAIAIPRFAAYRQRAFDARANSDLRNAATAEEAAYATNQAYVPCMDTGCNHPTLPGFRMSNDVRIIMFGFVLSGQPNNLGIGWSPSGSGKFFVWRSDLGGIQ